MSDDFEEDDFDDHFEDLWDADIEPPKFVVDGLLPTGITFMVAPPKTYKSTVEMALTLAVAGEPCTALPPDMLRVEETGIVIGASIEASPGELRYMVEQGMGVASGVHGRVRLLKDPWQFRLDDPGILHKLLALLDRKKPKLFWIDPLRDFHTLDEVDAGEMNRLLRPLQRWAKRNDASVLVVHHTRKRAGGDDSRNLSSDDARGTSAMFGLADGLIVLTPKGKNKVHFGVTLKRGESWEKTIQLSIWGSGEATPLIDGYARDVYVAKLRGEAPPQLAETTLRKAVSQLRSLGALTADGSVDPSKEKLVHSAVKKVKLGDT